MMTKRLICVTMVLAILFCHFPSPVYGNPDAIEKYKAFSIQNSSTEVMRAITLDLSQEAAFKSLLALERDARFKGVMSTQEDVDKYLKAINDTLTQSKDIQEMQKFLWATQREVVKYGLDVASKFEDKLPPNPVTPFIMPAIKRGVELITDNFYNEKLGETQDQRDQIVKLLVERAAAKNADLLLQTNLTDFERVYLLSQADLDALKREDLPAFNRVMNREAFRYLQEHRDQIQSNADRIDQLTGELNEKLPALRDELSKKVDTEFRNLGKSIAELTRRQEEHSKILDSLQVSVNENRERIKLLEKQMVAVQGDVHELKRVQEEHSKLIAENSLKINILSGYVFQTLSTDQKLEGIKRGDFDSVFGCKSGQPCSKKDELKGDLEKLKTTETIITVANTVTSALNAGFNFTTAIGLLKGDDAKRVGKAIGYIGAALQIGTGIARVFAGDITGILSIFSGLGGLFGSGPQESPELQFLKAMYEEMNKQFAEVREALVVIDKKIDKLGELLVEMYKSMMASFEYIGNKLDVIDWKVDVLQGLTEAILYTDFETCRTVERARTVNNYRLAAYSEFVSFYTPECGNCLKGLNDFSVTDRLTFFYLESLRSNSVHPETEQRVKAEVKEVFEPTADLFRAKYPEPYSEPALGALFFPAMGLADSNAPLFVVSKEGLSTLELSKALDKYINFEMVNQFTHLLLTYSPYFEISGNNSNFEPADMLVHLSRTSSQIGVRTTFLQARYEKLLKLTNYAIVQQSLLAGNLLIEPSYTILFTANQKEDEIKKAMRVLRSNQVFARNFACYLLHKNLRISEPAVGTEPSPSRYSDFAVLYEKVKQAPDDANTLKALNELVYLNDFKFKVGGPDKRLYITISRVNESADLLVPEPTSVLGNDMINTGALFGLLETRKKIADRLVGLGFTRTLPNVLANTPLKLDDFKYFYHPPE